MTLSVSGLPGVALGFVLFWLCLWFLWAVLEIVLACRAHRANARRLDAMEKRLEHHERRIALNAKQIDDLTDTGSRPRSGIRRFDILKAADEIVRDRQHDA